MGLSEDRAETTQTCPTCGERFGDPLELRTHELETHGGEGPGSALEGDETESGRSKGGGATAPP